MRAPDSPSRFLRAFAAIALLVLGAVAAMNWLVDPFDRFGRNWTGVYISAEREAKATEVRRVPHDAALLGDSKMALVNTARIPGLRMYNAAFGGASLAEIDAFARAYLGREKAVVIGLDLTQFGAPSPQPVAAVLRGGGFRDAARYLLDARGIEYGWKSLWSRRLGKAPSLRADGSYDDAAHWARVNAPDPVRTRDELNRQISELAALRPSGAAVDLLAGTVRELARRGVAVRLFLMPVHPETAAALRTLPDSAALARLRAALASRFPGMLDLTDGPLSRAENFFPSDPIHMTEPVARAAVEEALESGRPVVPRD